MTANFDLSQYHGAHFLSFGGDASDSEPTSFPARESRCSVFSEFGGTPNLSSLLLLTQPSPWSVQLILRCVVYFQKLAKVFTREIH